MTVGGWHWLQTIVLINLPIYVNEDARAPLEAPHMYPTSSIPWCSAFGVAFLAIGLRNFRRRVLSPASEALLGRRRPSCC